MYNLTKLLATTALLASASTAALAQADVDVDAGVEGEIGASADAPGADVSSDAASSATGAGTINYGSIISDLRTSGTTAADIEGLEADASIQIVALSEIRGNAAENAQALDEAVSSLESSLEDIRSALGANADISAELEAEGYTTDDVVAVTTSADGSVTVIVESEM